MSKTDNDAANAQTTKPSVSNVDDLRLAALLFDIVDAKGRRGAAAVPGVSYGAPARTAHTESAMCGIGTKE